MKKIRMYLALLAKHELFQKFFVTILNKFFGFLRGLKHRLYIALEKVGCYVVCKGPPFERTLENGPFLMPIFPVYCWASGKERIEKREFFKKIRYIYPKVSFWHFDGPPKITLNIKEDCIWYV